MFAKYQLICIILFFPLFVLSQVQPPDTTKNPYEYLLLDTNPQIEKPIYKPVLGIGRGVFTFFGDIKDNYSSNPLVGRYALIGSVSRNLNSFLELNFNITYGKLTGNSHTP